ncbi:DUF2167 domain-containing protein [Clostridium saccharobutylicum]|uniref:Membrane-anchored protein n=1 Tax=Clostridium saccharobutylicum DSM 13864 TaxID=1345695 RepID=U5MQZ5_CLOSA|nr:DUF2167 domain-containing protein [Clostridium saccharobutylicum]AGX41857.1 hypothetical protein CLSA_c08440 [Clostridium saccharobutylicum DSM 13864]AQR89131.1 hypothetical protein CLOSC_08270 [Clostridium saccharobutylicum]AQR99032.1 hypothetical protein CSACC_08340 [Clostridium saccharobutylicum]AQS13020.1 hypothetical protein CLOSACC_08340 [Clostridium saccharobutylicum]MBA2903859.1 putative membrane-anchored protein [Clostridium saccharobutylicum]
MFKRILTLIVVLITAMLNTGIAHAEASVDLSKVNWIEGPKTVDVGTDLAKLDLPSEYMFANGKDTKEIMKKMDNTVSGAEQGIVFPKDDNENWYVLFEFDDIGYVEDKDANKIDADKILSQIKEGTEKDNKERRKSGKPVLDIIGWDEKPHYDANTHNLTWSVLCNSEGTQIVNYNVRILGRGGVTEVTLVADKDEMDKVKPNLETIISKYSYKEGKKYTDYIKGDKVAEVGGLAALIAGGTGVAKIGIFAKILLMLKKAWMLIIVGIGAFFKGIMSIFKRKRKTTNEINNNSEDTTYGENTTVDAINENTSTVSDSLRDDN